MFISKLFIITDVIISQKKQFLIFQVGYNVSENGYKNLWQTTMSLIERKEDQLLFLIFAYRPTYFIVLPYHPPTQ
jgi:hypothetical protein